MSDEATQNYTFTLPDCGGLKPLLHTDWERFPRQRQGEQADDYR